MILNLKELMATTIQKWGNSLGLRIPKAIAEQVNLCDGTEVEFEASHGVLVVRPKRRRKFTLAALLAKAKGPNPHRGLDLDGPQGTETI